MKKKIRRRLVQYDLVSILTKFNVKYINNNVLSVYFCTRRFGCLASRHLIKIFHFLKWKLKNND